MLRLKAMIMMKNDIKKKNKKSELLTKAKNVR